MSRHIKKINGKTYYHLDSFSVKDEGDAEKRVLKRAKIPFSTTYVDVSLLTELFVCFDFGNFSSGRIALFKSILMKANGFVDVELKEGDVKKGFEKFGSLYYGKYSIGYDKYVEFSSHEKPDFGRFGESKMGDDAAAIGELVKGAKDLGEYIS